LGRFRRHRRACMLRTHGPGPKVRTVLPPPPWYTPRPGACAHLLEQREGRGGHPLSRRLRLAGAHTDERRHNHLQAYE
jgi:hypothetical protein